MVILMRHIYTFCNTCKVGHARVSPVATGLGFVPKIMTKGWTTTFT